MESNTGGGFWSKMKNFFNYIRTLFFNKELELTILGLQNAGKTTLVNVLANNKFDEDSIPTIGFNFRKLKKGKVEFKLWDLGMNKYLKIILILGGQPRFRDSWEKYCRTANAIVYVVDSADVGNLDVAKIQLHQLLAWPSLEGVPLLVLGNKNDLEGALNEEKLIASLDLSTIKDRVVACYSISCKNMVKIDNVLKWLTDVKTTKK
jgi:ADP-ribosylation factor-like protein 8